MSHPDPSKDYSDHSAPLMAPNTAEIRKEESFGRKIVDQLIVDGQMGEPNEIAERITSDHLAAMNEMKEKYDKLHDERFAEARKVDALESQLHDRDHRVEELEEKLAEQTQCETWEVYVNATRNLKKAFSEDRKKWEVALKEKDSRIAELESLVSLNAIDEMEIDNQDLKIAALESSLAQCREALNEALDEGELSHKRLAAKQEALCKFGRHINQCEFRDKKFICICGFDEAKKAG